MISHLPLPGKSLLFVLSLTGATVCGAVWTFYGDAVVTPKGSAFGGIWATNSNRHGTASTTRRGGAREKSGQVSSYVSQMLTLAAKSQAENHRLQSSPGGGNFGLGAKRADVFVNGVQIRGTLFPFMDVSVNLGNLAAGGRKIAFVRDRSIPPSIPQRGQPPTINEPLADVPPAPDTSVPDSGSTFLLMLCSGAGLLIMGGLASRRLEK